MVDKFECPESRVQFELCTASVTLANISNKDDQCPTDSPPSSRSPVGKENEATMSAVDVTSRFQDLKSTATDLASLVHGECDRMSIPFQPEAPTIKPTDSESQRISGKLPFSSDLKFTVDVNLEDSKKAFRAVVAGLDDDHDFLSLWTLHDHNPRIFPNPIGEVDMTPFSTDAVKALTSTEKQ